MTTLFCLASFMSALVFGGLGLLKGLTTIGCIRWLYHHGSSYRKALRHHTPEKLTGSVVREILDAHCGRSVWPWGVLDYTFYRKSKRWQFFGRIIFRLSALGPLALGTYILFNYVNGYELHPMDAAVWSVVAIIYQIDAILMATEAAFAYIIVGSFRRHYHTGMRCDDQENVNVENEVNEIFVLLPLVATAVAINALAFLATQNGWNAFTRVREPNLICEVIDAIYFVVTTLATVGYGDIVPTRCWGKIVAILMHIQSVLLIAGVFSSLFSFGLKKNEDGD